MIVSAASARSYMLDASSGSSISIWGSCESVNADASSGAGIEAIELTCSNAAIDASEGAHVRLTAHASLRADVSSGGGIDVFGRPQATDVDSSSGGSSAFLE